MTTNPNEIEANVGQLHPVDSAESTDLNELGQTPEQAAEFDRMCAEHDAQVASVVTISGERWGFCARCNRNLPLVSNKCQPCTEKSA